MGISNEEAWGAGAAIVNVLAEHKRRKEDARLARQMAEYEQAQKLRLEQARYLNDLALLEAEDKMKTAENNRTYLQNIALKDMELRAARGTKVREHKYDMEKTLAQETGDLVSATLGAGYGNVPGINEAIRSRLKIPEFALPETSPFMEQLFSMTGGGAVPGGPVLEGPATPLGKGTLTPLPAPTGVTPAFALKALTPFWESAQADKRTDKTIAAATGRQEAGIRAGVESEYRKQGFAESNLITADELKRKAERQAALNKGLAEFEDMYAHYGDVEAGQKASSKIQPYITTTDLYAKINELYSQGLISHKKMMELRKRAKNRGKELYNVKVRPQREKAYREEKEKSGGKGDVDKTLKELGL